MSKASIAAVLLALGVLSLQEGTNATVVPPSGLQPALAAPAVVETVALRRGRTASRHVVVRHRGLNVGTRRVASAHRGVAVRTRHVASARRGVAVRTRHVASARRGIAVRTRHVAVRQRAVAARRTHVAVSKRSAVAVKSTEVVRPVRPWVRQPYYGSVFDGVTLGAIIAATAVPMSPSFDLCWYWSSSSQTRGYWDFCQ